MKELFKKSLLLRLTKPIFSRSDKNESCYVELFFIKFEPKLKFVTFCGTRIRIRLRVQFGINCTSKFFRKYQNCTRALAVYMQSLPRKAQRTREFPRSRSRVDFIYSDSMSFKRCPQLQIFDKISRFTNSSIVFSCKQ